MKASTQLIDDFGGSGIPLRRAEKILTSLLTNTRLQFFGNHWRFLDNRSGAAICVKEYAHSRCHRGRPQKKSTDCARMFRRSSSAVATSREGHRSPISGPAVLHRQWDGPVSDSGPISRAGSASDWPCKAYRASSSPLLPLCASSFLSSSATRNFSSSRSPGFIQCGHLALLW
jgi:hypothetical protein